MNDNEPIGEMIDAHAAKSEAQLAEETDAALEQAESVQDIQLAERIAELETLVEGVARGFITYGGYEWDSRPKKLWTTSTGPIILRNQTNGNAVTWRAYYIFKFAGEHSTMLEAMQAAIDAAKEADGS